MERDYNESFEVAPENKVEISNKYGEVIIRVWNENRVKISVRVTAEGKNQDVVNKTMSRVNVAMRKVGQIVIADTEIQSNNSGISFLNDVEDYSKALFGKQKLTVNYEVWMPENIDLRIINKYGDVYLASLSGNIGITLAHGDLKGNKVNGRLEMDHSYGKSTFDYINRGRFNLRGAEITIEEGSSFSFQSSSSTIRLYNTHYAKFDSRNDKIYASNVGELVGMGRFSDLQADRISRNVDLNFSFGEISLSQIDQKFKTINLIGKSTDMNVVLNQASYINAKIKGEEEKMIVPNSMMSLTRDYNEETKMVMLSGMVGYTNDFKSMLNIDADGGDVIISIKDTPIFTDRR
jgi:hypothetical protein